MNGADDTVLMEIKHPTGWSQLAQLGPDAPPGSVSSESPAGREIYLFGFVEGTPGVWRSVFGTDVAEGSHRTIYSIELELLADLRSGPHELPVHQANVGDITLRFSLTNPKD